MIKFIERYVAMKKYHNSIRMNCKRIKNTNIHFENKFTVIDTLDIDGTLYIYEKNNQVAFMTIHKDYGNKNIIKLNRIHVFKYKKTGIGTLMMLRLSEYYKYHRIKTLVIYADSESVKQFYDKFSLYMNINM